MHELKVQLGSLLKSTLDNTHVVMRSSAMFNDADDRQGGRNYPRVARVGGSRW